MQTLEKKNGFDRTIQRIVGLLRKSSGSDWFRAGAPFDTSTALAMIMDTMRMGNVLWEDSKITRIEDDLVISTGVPDGDSVPYGWKPYSSVLLVDEDGLLLTFTSSSWGGKTALEDLIPQYTLRGQKSFPLVRVSSRARNNQYNTVDPVFNIVGWTERTKFEAILGPAAHEVPVIAAPEQPKKSSAEIIGDQLPGFDDSDISF